MPEQAEGGWRSSSAGRRERREGNPVEQRQVAAIQDSASFSRGAIGMIGLKPARSWPVFLPADDRQRHPYLLTASTLSERHEIAPGLVLSGASIRSRTVPTRLRIYMWMRAPEIGKNCLASGRCWRRRSPSGVLAAKPRPDRNASGSPHLRQPFAESPCEAGYTCLMSSVASCVEQGAKP